MRITLSEWNKIYFARPRTRRSLYKYIRDGKIQPPPVKVGKEYEIDKSAIFINDFSELPAGLLERINGQKKEKRK